MIDKKLLSLTVGLPAVFLLGSLAPLTRQGGGNGAGLDLPASVAVVDYDRVYKAYPLAGQQLNELKAMREEVRQRLDKLKKQVQDLENEASILAPWTDKWMAAKERADAAKFALDYQAKINAERIERESEKHRQEMFEAIDDAIAKVAAKSGLQLVLRYRSIPEGARRADRLRIHDQREVVYYAKKLDLTEAVIKLLK